MIEGKVVVQFKRNNLTFLLWNMKVLEWCNSWEKLTETAELLQSLIYTWSRKKKRVFSMQKIVQKQTSNCTFRCIINSIFVIITWIIFSVVSTSAISVASLLTTLKIRFPFESVTCLRFLLLLTSKSSPWNRRKNRDCKSQNFAKEIHGQFRIWTLYVLTVEESTILVSLIALLASRGNFCSSPSKSISSTTSKDLGLPPRACGATPIRLLKSLEKKEKKMCDEI